jgi:opacity protein-like surface antigen
MPRPYKLFVPGLRLTTALSALLTVLGATSAAQAECPPGSWFCADPVDDKPAATAPGKAESEVKTVSPGESTTVAPGGSTTIIVQTAPPPAPAPAPRPPPVAPPARAVYAAPAKPPPPVVRRRSAAEWGFNLRLQGAMMSSKKQQAADDAGMGGLGFSLRARPTGHFALDFGVDFLSGTDFNGYKRSEVPFTVNAMLFVNPKDRAQLYFLGGMGWSSAQVEVTNGATEKYSYFGLQSGVGLEYRATRTVALNVDLIGFVRGRTDRAAANNPEFIDPSTGRTTNTSGGGLLRGGLTFYW